MVHHSSKLHIYSFIINSLQDVFQLPVSQPIFWYSDGTTVIKKIESLFEPSPDFNDSIKINIVKTRNKRKKCQLDKNFIRNNLFGYSIMIIIMVQHYIIFFSTYMNKNDKKRKMTHNNLTKQGSMNPTLTQSRKGVLNF